MFRRRRLTCQQVVELVTEYLDGVMEPARRARFEAHLSGCGGCTAYLAQFRATVAVVGRLDDPWRLTPPLSGGHPPSPGGDVPAPVMSDLLSAFRTWADDRNGV